MKRIHFTFSLLLVIVIFVLCIMQRCQEQDERYILSYDMTECYYDSFSYEREDIYFADGWKSGEIFGSIWRRANAVYEDDRLKLYIDHDYESSAQKWSSAEYVTQQFCRYGVYEVCMKPIAVEGAISAFFTYTCPGFGEKAVWDEIDIEFLGNDTTKVQFNYYTNGVGKHEYLYDLGFDAADSFHTYGFIWEKETITWTVDGLAVYSVHGKIPSRPSRMMLNTWVTHGLPNWAGEFSGEVPICAEYEWVRYKREN